MRRNLIEVQVKRIEVAFSPDLVPVLNGDPTSAMIDKAIFRECLQGSIDMNAGHPGRVPQLLLRHRQMKVSRIDNTGSVHANGDFAQYMGNARPCVTPPDVEHPFSINRGVHQTIDPERLADGGPLQGHFPQSVAINVGHLKFGQGLDTVVGNVEKQML